MARINRSDVIQKAVNDLAISTANEKVPNETLDKVQLTYDLNKSYSNFIVEGNRFVTGSISVSLPTTDARADIFLTSLDFHVVKDATCDLATGAITIGVTPLDVGIVKNLAQVSVLTLNADSIHIHCDFTYPIKLKPNTIIITSVNTYTVGLMARTLSATGYITSTN